MTSGRDRVLETVRAADGPLDAAAVASRLDLHVTTARFHLNNLLERGDIAARSEPGEGRGRPRLLFTDAQAHEPARAPLSTLLPLLLDQLGSTERAREELAARAGRVWVSEAMHNQATPVADVPDPLTIASNALDALGFKVSTTTSFFGVHELRLCSCPLSDIAREHPEVARGVQRGVIEEALALGSPTLASQYAVSVTPDAHGGECEVSVRLARRDASVHTPN